MIQRPAILLPLVATMVAGACNRKLELLPPGARNITRTDSVEELKSEEAAQVVKMREYRFASPGSKSGNDFVCESREFADAGIALNAAKKSIAERPEEELKSERAHFARSGRSLWLRIDRHLLWCMYTGSQVGQSNTAVSELTESFRAKFRGAS